MYCIECEREIETSWMLQGNKLYNHTVPYTDVPYLTYDVCDGIITQCPPPPITEEDWDFIFAHEPSPDEMGLMEQEADVLLQSLIGE